MCGICASVVVQRPIPEAVNANIKGCNEVDPSIRQELESKLHASLDQIRHRGPDARNVWISPDNAVGLAHCRLSIQDLTSNGNQPLHDDEDQIHAIVNGEIYDHENIRDRCASATGYKFKSHSDSELVIALYKQYGAPKFLDHLRGEFAFVIYDGRTGDVIAARDRFGIKPLFWTIVDSAAEVESGKRLLLGSEMKAFLPMDWKPEWDTDSIALGDEFLTNGTVFKGVQKLSPGHYMIISPDGAFSIHKYWDHSYINKNKTETRKIEDLVLQVREKLIESIRLRLSADVPVGIYLSGGLDSSAIAGIVNHLVNEEGQKMGTKKEIACFSIAFDKNTPFDESEIARRTADHLGVQMYTQDMNENELALNFEDTVWHNEQHFYDLGIVGKFCLSKLARDKGFKVVLTGEGADEIFGGYHWLLPDFLRELDQSMSDSFSNQNAADLKNIQSRSELEVAMFFKMAAGTESLEISQEQQKATNNNLALRTMIGSRGKGQVLMSSLRKYSFEDKMQRVIDSWPLDVKNNIRDSWHSLHTSLYASSKILLPNVLLVVLGDRAEMSHSVEGRLPYLDHELVELVDGISPSLKVHYESSGIASKAWWSNSNQSITHNFMEKWILREAVKPFITEEMFQRRKHLFMAPMRYKHHGPINQLLMGLLTQDNVENLGFVDWATVNQDVQSAFGDGADSGSFRRCLDVASWVVLSKRFAVPKAII